MKIGMMNNPTKDLLKEIRWAGENGFDFVEIVVEPTKAWIKDINLHRINIIASEYKLEFIGHSPHFLPVISPFESLKQASLKEILTCLEVFKGLHVKKVGIHPKAPLVSLLDKETVINLNIEFLEIVVREAQRLHIKVMIENMFHLFDKVAELKALFDKIKDLGFLLDVAHANLFTEKNKTEEFLKEFHFKLEHVHMSDNKGGKDDLHLPLGAGNIEWRRIVGLLKKYGYDDTITLEVFSREREYLLFSMRKLKQLWTESTRI